MAPSTSPAGRLMNLEERSEISVSNWRRPPRELDVEPRVSSVSVTSDNGTTRGPLVLPEWPAS